MIDRLVTATNKINSQTIVIFMFCLAAALLIYGSWRHMSDPAQGKVFDAAFALITGGLGLLKSSDKPPADAPLPESPK